MLLIFTDLDGTLLNQDDYQYAQALPVLAELKKKQIPVIIVTSKTKAEVAYLSAEIGLNDPFIVENGSGIFIPLKDQRFDLKDTIREGEYHLYRLGMTYQQARMALQEISQALGENLKGFGDLTVDEIIDLTGLSPEKVKLAKMRDFSEPFITPKSKSILEIEAVVKQHGYQVVVGDRFSHLISINAGKGKAVNWLLNHYHHQGETMVSVGLGNSPNDLSLLENVDIPIIMPNLTGVHPRLKDKPWQVALQPGCQGWATMVRKILATYYE
jgi:mannosyl-3-phosphoglycerate phosphatase